MNIFRPRFVILFILLSLTTTMAQADIYDSLWQKAEKARTTSKTEQSRQCVDRIYNRALRESNILQLTRALYAYDALGVVLPEDSIVRNAKRVWTARRQERNAVQHALLTHMLGRLTDNDYLLALSVADTTFLKQQRVREHLPMVKGYSLFEIFGDYLRQRDMPDSVFVGWQRPVEEDTVVRKRYNFGNENENETQSYENKDETRSYENEVNSQDHTTTVVSAENTSEQSKHQPQKPQSQPQPQKPQLQPQQSQSQPTAAPAPALSGSYSAYVFNVPGGMSRTCLVETQSGRPVRQWRLHRSDGRGQETDINADGNGHVWQRPTQIHNYDGIYDWSLRPVTTDTGNSNTLRAKDFHNGGGWSSSETNSRELYLDIQREDKQKGLISVTVRAPHRNLTLMRDITSGGRLIEQRQYNFSDFIHFDLQWREAYGDEALVTFAYALGGHLYTAELKISRPESH